MGISTKRIPPRYCPQCREQRLFIETADSLDCPVCDYGEALCGDSVRREALLIEIMKADEESGIYQESGYTAIQAARQEGREESLKEGRGLCGFADSMGGEE